MTQIIAENVESLRIFPYLCTKFKLHDVKYTLQDVKYTLQDVKCILQDVQYILRVVKLKIYCLYGKLCNKGIAHRYGQWK